MKLQDLLGKDLAGYRIVPAYWAELHHTLWATFPAIYGENEIVVCLDKELLVEVLKGLTPRRHKIREILVLVDKSANLCLDLAAVLKNREIGKEAEDITIFTKEMLQVLRNQKGEGRLRWAPGLVGNDMTREEFAQTLERALKSDPPM